MKTIIFLGCIGLFWACESGPNPDATNNINNINNINNANNLNNINNVNNINNINNTEVIPANVNKSETQALAQLFPLSTASEKTSTSGNYWELFDDNQETLGYALVKSHFGFNGPIRTMLGISRDHVTIGLETIDQRESWWDMIPLVFFTQFSGRTMESFTLLPDYNPNCSPGCHLLYESLDVDGVSGATWTSDAMVRNVMDALLHHDEIHQ